MSKDDGSPMGAKKEEIPEGLRMSFRKWDSSRIGQVKVLPLIDTIMNEEG